MNKERKQRIEITIGELENVLEEEDEIRDNMPENLQNSSRYEESEAASENLQTAIDALYEIVNY